MKAQRMWCSCLALQMMFMAFVFGGPEVYTGRDMWSAHKGLVLNRGLNDSHFDAIKRHLGDTLAELGVDQVNSSYIVMAPFFTCSKSSWAPCWSPEAEAGGLQLPPSCITFSSAMAAAEGSCRTYHGSVHKLYS
jgi:hypothetical protein